MLKRVFEWDGSTWGTPVAETKFVYDGLPLTKPGAGPRSPEGAWRVSSRGTRVIMERNGLASDAVPRKHTWGLDLSGTFERAGGIGGLLGTLDTAGTPGTTTDDRTFIYTYDANGNVSELIETTAGLDYGTVAAHYEYTPYGKRFNDPAPSEYDQPFRFSTKWFDDETGLGYWGYRHYSPEWGRWVSRDPIGERGGWNVYEYVGSRPQLRWNAHGLKGECDYCGPDVTAFLGNLICYAYNWRAAQGTVSGRQAREWLRRWGGSFDWESKHIKTPNCPKGEKCQNTYWLCGECVHDHWIGNFMVAFAERLLGIWDLVADAGASQAQLTGEIGMYLDPPWDKAGYEIARDVHDTLKPGTSFDLCALLKSDRQLWDEANNPRVMPEHCHVFEDGTVFCAQRYPPPRSAKEDYKDCSQCREELKAEIPGGAMGSLVRRMAGHRL